MLKAQLGLKAKIRCESYGNPVGTNRVFGMTLEDLVDLLPDLPGISYLTLCKSSTVKS